MGLSDEVGPINKLSAIFHQTMCKELFDKLRADTAELYKSYRLNHFSLFYIHNYYVQKSNEHNLENFVIEDKINESVRFDGENMIKETFDNGKYQFLVSSSAIVNFYQIWEDKYRKKISKEVNIDLIKSEVYYELNKLRQSIIHNSHRPTHEFKKVANNFKFILSEDKLELTVDEIHKIYKILLQEIDDLEKKYCR